MSALLTKTWPLLLLTLAGLLLPLLLPVQYLYWPMLPLMAGTGLYLAMKNSKSDLQETDARLYASSGELARSIEDYLSALESCSSQEIAAFNTELGQVKTVVGDAVETMSDSFHGVNKLATEQASMIYGLLSSLDGSGGKKEQGGQMTFQRFAAETDKVLGFFVEHILAVSKQSMAMVNVINDVDEHMRKIEKLLSDVQEIADQTNLLALNAAIEAARAGEAGRGFAVVADEVRNLSRNSDKFSEEIRVVVNSSKNNIEQARQMIETMASKDMNIAISSKANVDEMMGEVAEINKSIAASLSQVSSLTGQIEDNVGNAVRALQFEDMTRQLVDYIQANTQHFQALTDEMRVGLGFLQTGDALSWIRELRSGTRRLQEMQRQWRATEQKAVSQESMAEGEIELF